MLSREQVLHIAKLAKLDLTDEELLKFQKQLSTVIDYFDVLNKVDTSSIPPRTHSDESLVNRYREMPESDATLDRKDALKNAKRKNDKYFITDAVL